MAQQTPPPYLGINGLYVQTDKHVDTTLAQYNGNARPGQLVVDTANYALYVGNASGALTAVGGGGGGGTYGDANVAAYLPTNAVDVGAANVVATGNVSAVGNISVTGNVIATGNIVNSGAQEVTTAPTSWVGNGTTVVFTYPNTLPLPVFVIGRTVTVSGWTDGRVNGTYTVVANGAGPAHRVTVTNPVTGSGGPSGATITQYAVGGNITTTETITGGRLVTNGNATVGGQLLVSGIALADLLRTASVTVATLPTAVAGLAGARAFVSDATATTFASIVAGGSTNAVPVYCDGTNWRIG